MTDVLKHKGEWGTPQVQGLTPSTSGGVDRYCYTQEGGVEALDAPDSAQSAIVLGKTEVMHQNHRRQEGCLPGHSMRLNRPGAA